MRKIRIVEVKYSTKSGNFMVMSISSPPIIEAFGNRLRLRVCGFLIQNNELLLVKHLHIGSKGVLWAPPGGGMDFGENAVTTLKREFLEETGLEIEVRDLAVINEYLEPPLHAIELFFNVVQTGGTLQQGHDPEMSGEDQIIREVRYVSFRELQTMDQDTLHHVLKGVKSLDQLLAKTAYLINGEKR